jgi:ParB-like chromosome segregation protein Spo0J
MILPTKERVKEAVADGGKAIGYAKRIVGLLETQEEHTKIIGKQSAAIEKLAAENATLRAAMQALQDREEIVIARAGQAAAEAVTASLAALSHRVGFIEGAASKRG